MSRICDCSQIQLRRAKNHYCSATARSLFFFLGAFFLVNLRTPAWRKGLRAPWAPGGDLIHTLCYLNPTSLYSDINTKVGCYSPQTHYLGPSD